MILKGILSDSKWYVQIILLICIPVFFLLLSSSLFYLIAGWTQVDPLNTGFLLTEQATTSCLTFILGGWLYAYLMDAHAGSFLSFHKNKNVMQYIYAILAVICIMPCVGVFSYWNTQLHMPEALQGVENWMRMMEESANDLTLQFMQGQGWGDLVISLLVMGLIPAFGEEIFFRGCLQNTLVKLTKNVHWGVWITGFIFSAIHLQFFGFFPRWILGVVMGYLLVYGKSLWFPIVAHFVNNASTILAYRFYYFDTQETNINLMGVPPEFVVSSLVSILTFAFFMYLFVVAGNRKA